MQSSSITLMTLGNKDAGNTNILKEVIVGLITGIFCGIITGIGTYFIISDINICFTCIYSCINKYDIWSYYRSFCTCFTKKIRN